MTGQMHEGYVTGGSTPEGHNKTVWRVRVKDSSSPFNGRSLIVASVHGDMELARGLNVMFAIGTLDDLKGNPVPRAVDVRLK